MEYQINYTRGRDICASEYINARSHMEAWSQGIHARAQGRERVHSVYPMSNIYFEEDFMFAVIQDDEVIDALQNQRRS
jgi:hypothetical protein